MTYAILQIAASAYADIKGRLLALDEKLKPTPSYASEYIHAAGDAMELLVFGPVAFEALPEPAPHVDDLNDAVAVGLALEDDARALFMAIAAMHPDLEPPSWEAVPKDTKAIYVVGARAVRRRYLPWTLDDWTPTAATINALPEPLRAYIRDLETRADPAGEVLEAHQVRQQAAGVEAMYLADKQDAERWRALLRVARIRMFGSAGVDPKTGERTDGTYVHFGAEFWSTMGPTYDPVRFAAQHNNEWGIKALTAIADAVLEREAAEAAGRDAKLTP